MDPEAENYENISICHKLWNCKKIVKVRQCNVYYTIENKTSSPKQTIFRKKSHFMPKKYIKWVIRLDFLKERNSEMPISQRVSRVLYLHIQNLQLIQDFHFSPVFIHLGEPHHIYKVFELILQHGLTI